MAVHHVVRDFKLAGVALPKQEKQKFAELSMAMTQQVTKFSNHVLDATGAWTHLITDSQALAGISEIAQSSMTDLIDSTVSRIAFLSL